MYGSGPTPRDAPFWENTAEDGFGETVEFNDNITIVTAIKHKSTAEIVVVHTNYDKAVEVAKKAGVWRESVARKVPLNMDPKDFRYPNLP
jgi:hypothetical protein